MRGMASHAEPAAEVVLQELMDVPVQEEALARSTIKEWVREVPFNVQLYLRTPSAL